MSNRTYILAFFVLLLVNSVSYAQNRFYHVYVDNDAITTTGCDVNLPAFATTIEGVQSRLTITTDSALPPNIVATNLHQCNGASFDAGTALPPSALGLNTGVSGADVFEAAVDVSSLAINSSGNVRLYYATQSDTASDIVLTNASGGPIYLGFTFPVPALGIIALGMLLLLLAFSARKNINKKITLSIVLIGLSTLAYAMTIIVDGQTGDWSGINPANTDPINDTSALGSFADLTAVFVTKNTSTVFVRMDVVDVENQAPIANSASDTTNEDSSVLITVTGSDAEGSPLTFSADTPPPNGSLSSFSVINATTSTVTYTPNPDYNGSDQFTIIANDGQVNSGPANVNITITPINDEPLFTTGGNINQLKTAGPYSQIWATAISAGAFNETAQILTFNILANDNAAIFSTQPSINAGGTLSFEGVLNSTGTANISVDLTDNGGTANGGDDTSTTVNFTITLQAVNDEPSFTVGASQNVLEDVGAVSIPAWATNILAGPPDEIGQILTFNITANNNTSLFSAGPAVAANGTLTYTTAADANGTANISVELMDDGGTANGGDDTSPPQSFSITINSVNDVPSYTSGGDVTVDENSGAFDTLWATAISAGPTNESAQVLTFNIVSVTNAGLFATAPDVDSTSGNLSFTPTTDTFGTSTVTINLMDNGLTANGGIDTSADISFVITVNEVNEAPVLDFITNPTIDELTLLAFTATATDPNIPAQNLTFTLGGTVPAGANMTTGGNFTWTPSEAQGTTGSFTFDVIVTDDGTNPNNLTDSQSITVTVNKVNTAPVLNAIGPQLVDELVNLNFTATATDADSPAQNLTFSLGGAVPSGATISGAGAFNWIPTETQGPGVYTFDVIVTDDGVNLPNLTNTETISVTVNDVNSAPVLAVIGNQTVDEETLLSFNASASDSDLPAQSLTFSLSGTIPAGASITAGGVFTWTPTEAQGPGVYNFDVVVTDNGANPANLSGTETIAVTVNEVNAAPTANAQATTTDDATPISITLTGSDPESNPLTFSVVMSPAVGNLGAITQLTPTSASVTYTPTVSGTGDFTFMVFDGSLNSPAATVTLPVTVSNTAPTAVNDAYDVSGNVGLNVPVGSGVVFNDTDPELNTLTVSAFDALSVQGGNVSVNANGSFTYVPPAGYNGADSFGYTVSDGSLTDTATVNLTVADMVWFIDNSQVAAGNGTLATPFNTLAGLQASALDAAGDCIFIDESGNGDYTGGLTLLSGQFVVGKGTSSGLATVCGITLATNSATLPAIAGTRPTLSGSGITLGTNNVIRGLNIGNTGGSGILSSAAFGTWTMSESSILGNGRAINLNGGGTLNLNLDEITSNGGFNGIIMGGVGGSITVGVGGTNIGSTTGGDAIFIQSAPAATNFNFGATTITGTANGVLANANNATSQITFTSLSITAPSGTGLVANSGIINIGGSSNTISATGNPALNVSNTSTGTGWTFSSLSSTNSTTTGINLSNVTGTITANGGNFTGATTETILMNNSSGTFTANFNAVNIGANNATTGENGIHLITTGTATSNLNVNGSSFTGSRRDMILAEMGGSGGGTVNIGSTTANMFTQDQSPDVLGGDDVIHISANGSGTINTTVSNNTILTGTFNFEGDGIAIQNLSTFTGTHRATVSSNTIGMSGINGSAFDPLDNQGDAGIEIIGAGNSTMIALVNNNSVFDYNASGIEASFVDNGNYDITITNNTINDGLGSSGFDAAIAVFGGDSVTACVQVDSNALNDPTNEEVDVDILGTGIYRDPGLLTLTDPGLEAHLISTNTGTAPYTTVAFTVGVIGGVTCVQP